MSCFRNLLVPAIALAVYFVSVAALAQGPTYNRGRTPSAEEIRAWDSSGVEGKELPPGNGTPQQGAKLYAEKCTACHGPNGEGQEQAGGGGPRLVGSKGALQALRAWPFATSIWNIINKAMPQGQEGSLSADEVYALTAFLLYRNDIIKESDVINAQSLPKVQMPNRYGFVPSPWPEPELKLFRARCPLGICP